MDQPRSSWSTRPKLSGRERRTDRLIDTELERRKRRREQERGTKRGGKMQGIIKLDRGDLEGAGGKKEEEEKNP